jgi:hypothetical protein
MAAATANPRLPFPEGVTHASFACLAAALPSHLAAAALLTSLAVHFTTPRTMAELVATFAECRLDNLLVLCQVRNAKRG